MPITTRTWQPGDTLTSDKLNQVETNLNLLEQSVNTNDTSSKDRDTQIETNSKNRDTELNKRIQDLISFEIIDSQKREPESELELCTLEIKLTIPGVLIQDENISSNVNQESATRSLFKE